MMKCNNVSVKYGRRNVLYNLSFNAKPSQITAVLGKNGTGKTTLFKAITGNLRYSGSILIDNMEISSLKGNMRARQVAMMPQTLATPQVRVSELVSFGRQPYIGISGVLSRKDREIVTQVIYEAGIEQLDDSYVNEISGGERQKAFFAMILAQQTPMILLDEPTSNLDAAYSKRFLEFIRKAADDGKTVLVAMHDINAAIEVADQILYIGDDSTVYCGSTEEFVQSGIIEKAFELKRYECADGKDARKVIFL